MTRVFAPVLLAFFLAAAAAMSDPVSAPPSDPPDRAGEVDPAPGVIEGVMELENRPSRRVAQRYPGGGAGPSKTIQPIPPVVFLRGSVPAADGGAVDGEAPVISQRDTTFQPSLLVVRTGDTVAFPNRDPFFHNVFSYSDAARFDLGRYPRGQSKSVTFEKPGVVRIYCEVHDFMRAAVVVTRNPYHTRPDADGRFRLDGVPPGRYTVVGWHADRGRVTEEITVPEGGRVEVRLDFS